MIGRRPRLLRAVWPWLLATPWLIFNLYWEPLHRSDWLSIGSNVLAICAVSALSLVRRPVSVAVLLSVASVPWIAGALTVFFEAAHAPWLADPSLTAPHRALFRLAGFSDSLAIAKVGLGTSSALLAAGSIHAALAAHRPVPGGRRWPSAGLLLAGLPAVALVLSAALVREQPLLPLPFLPAAAALLHLPLAARGLGAGEPARSRSVEATIAFALSVTAGALTVHAGSASHLLHLFANGSPAGHRDALWSAIADELAPNGWLRTWAAPLGLLPAAIVAGTLSFRREGGLLVRHALVPLAIAAALWVAHESTLGRMRAGVEAALWPNWPADSRAFRPTPLPGDQRGLVHTSVFVGVDRWWVRSADQRLEPGEPGEIQDLPVHASEWAVAPDRRLVWSQLRPALARARSHGASMVRFVGWREPLVTPLDRIHPESAAVIDHMVPSIDCGLGSVDEWADPRGGARLASERTDAKVLRVSGPAPRVPRRSAATADRPFTIVAGAGPVELREWQWVALEVADDTPVPVLLDWLARLESRHLRLSLLVPP